MSKYNEFPFGTLTQEELKSIPHWVLRPNELKAILNNYLLKETNKRLELLEFAKSQLTFLDFLGNFFGYSTDRMKIYNDLLNKSEQPIKHQAQEKDYQSFLALREQEVNEVVILQLAYNYSLEVRRVLDFYDRDGLSKSVCYVNHNQKRAIGWFKKNAGMIKSFLDDYYFTLEHQKGS